MAFHELYEHGPIGAAHVLIVIEKDDARRGCRDGWKNPVGFSGIARRRICASRRGRADSLRAIVTEPWTSNVFIAVGSPLPALSFTCAPAGAVWHSISASSGYFTWTPAAGQEGPQNFVLGATRVAGTASFTRTVQTYPAGTDLIPPSSRGGFVVDQISWDTCRVTWTAATDNYGIALYRVTASHR